MLHPNTEVKFISREVGYGVVATDFIPAGTITWALDTFDQVFSQKDFEKMDHIHQHVIETYSFRNRNGNYVLCWDNGRFVNHSFKSNCLTTAYGFEIAIRDINIGTQLTDDYGYLNIERPFRGIDEGTKRKVVYPDDLLRHHKVWDKKIKKVFHKIPVSPQPLGELLTEVTWEKINLIISTNKEIDSILENYYPQQTTI
jgi:hypothetical protein